MKLRRLRQILASLFFIAITLLIVDISGALHTYLGWIAKVQFFPAVISVNVVVFVSIILVTLLFGRVYCSVICPLGVMQDLFIRTGNIFQKTGRYHYRKDNRLLRAGFLTLFVLFIVMGLNWVASLIEPYSVYGRTANQIVQPLYIWGNNALAALAKRMDSYAFYERETIYQGATVLAVTVATVLAVGAMALRWGRAWCNNVCPVGTVLGLVSRFSVFGPRIDASKCVSCGKCEHACKASCIDSKSKTIDHSRCIDCMNCLNECKLGALTFGNIRSVNNPQTQEVDSSRRKFVTTTAAITGMAVAQAQEMKVDGGLARLIDKQLPKRVTQLKPAGSVSLSNFERHCTACQLCVSGCPNRVLRPSKDLTTLMQPEMAFDHGYCRPECTHCSDVCPTGAIRAIDAADKSSIQIGRAVWVEQNCIVSSSGTKCGHCASHCPTGAIRLVAYNGSATLTIPTVDESLCIGCGACEHLCPARPFSAIYVEGREVHRHR